MMTGANLVVCQLQFDERNVRAGPVLGLDLSLEIDQIHVVRVHTPLVKLAVLPLNFTRKALQP